MEAAIRPSPDGTRVALHSLALQETTTDSTAWQCSAYFNLQLNVGPSLNVQRSTMKHYPIPLTSLRATTACLRAFFDRETGTRPSPPTPMRVPVRVERARCVATVAAILRGENPSPWGENP